VLPTELELNFVDILTNPTICYVFHASIHYRERERRVMSKVFGSVMSIPAVLPIRIFLYPSSQKFSCKVGQGGRGIHEFILFLFNKIEE
jgi:hypothetical protein